MKQIRVLVPVVRVERGREVGNQEVLVGAQLARGSDSILRASWSGLRVSRLLTLRALAFHVPFLFAADSTDKSTILEPSRRT